MIVKVKPGSKLNSMVWNSEGFWSIKIKDPATEGKANKALLSFLSEKLGLRQNQIILKSGRTSSNKVLEIDDDPELIKFLDELKKDM